MVELFRNVRGARGERDTHVVRAEFLADGSLRLWARNSGPGVEEAFYQDEIEARLTIRPEDVPVFTLAVLRLGFGNEKRMTLAALREAATAASIAAEFDVT